MLLPRGRGGAEWNILGLAEHQSNNQKCILIDQNNILELCHCFLISLTRMRLAAQQLHFKGDPLVPLVGAYPDKPCFDWRNKVVPHFLQIVGVALENLFQRHKDASPW